MTKECENCPNETFTTSCKDCGCSLCENCKNILQDKSFCDLCITEYTEKNKTDAKTDEK